MVNQRVTLADRLQFGLRRAMQLVQLLNQAIPFKHTMVLLKKLLNNVQALETRVLKTAHCKDSENSTDLLQRRLKILKLAYSHQLKTRMLMDHVHKRKRIPEVFQTTKKEHSHYYKTKQNMTVKQSNRIKKWRQTWYET